MLFQILKWVWLAVIAGILLSIGGSVSYNFLTTGQKVSISWQAVTDVLSYWPLIGASLLILSCLTFWASQQEKERQQQLANSMTPSITADTYVHQQITNQAATTEVHALHQLPPAPRDFTGRQAELDTLQAAMNERGLALSGLQGMGGIGKTVLGLVVAHSIKERYPDAQFFLDLKGTTTPLSMTDAMQHVIRAYHPDSKLPDTENELRGLYHSVLDGQRALLFLDNAANKEQVEALLPPDTCFTLVTSRQHFTLPGLFVQEIETLPPDDARTLVLTVAGRIGEAADELCRLCGYLPLALRVSANALAERPGLTVDNYLRRLRDTPQRPQLTQVDVSLTLSFDLLNPDQQHQLCALAVFPDTFDHLGVAAVWDLDPDPAHDALDTLAQYSLVEWNAETQRYHLHDLVRDFATLKQTDADQAVSHERHAEHYQTVLATANDLYLQGGEYIGQGVALFDLEVENIQAGHTWAVAHAETHPTATRLTRDYPGYGASLLNLRQHPRDQIAWLQVAVTAARTLGDRRGEGATLGNLGLAYAELGEVPKAIDHYQKRLVIAREISDRRSEGHSLGISFAV